MQRSQRQQQAAFPVPRKRRRWSNWLIGGGILLLIVAITVGAILIIRQQGSGIGATTLTILSIVLGMIVSILTLIVNFFQWRSSAQEKHTAPDLPHIVPLHPPVSISTVLDASGAISSSPSPFPDISQQAASRFDWGEAPAPKQLYGRARERSTLKQWILQDGCRLVGVQGLGGVGKTALSTLLVREISSGFDAVFWRSLQNAPPLELILEQSLRLFPSSAPSSFPAQSDAQILLWLDYLRRYRCLVVLDNFETVLQEGNRAGFYRAGYEGFGRLLELVGSTEHQSCLLLTMREKPRELARLEGKTSPVRSLVLHGVEQSDARQMLQHEDLVGDGETWQRFIALYSGNPLALKLASEPIRELFAGNIQAFLAQGETITGDMQEILEQQFLRLSPLEQEVLYWLALAREKTWLDTLRNDIIHTVPKGEFQEALKSLRRRSLVESSDTALFSLQAVIMEYVTDRFTTQIIQELHTGQVQLIISHALLQTQARDSTRDSRLRFVLAPVVNALSGGQMQMGEQRLKDLLKHWQSASAHSVGYGPGNVLNLLVQMHLSLRGYDFSHLLIRQAYLRGANLADANFAYAHLDACVFTEIFGNILALALEPREGLLAAATNNSKIELWKIPAGTPLLTFSGHRNWIRSLTFSPDGKTLVSGSDDETIRLWNVSTGECLACLREHQGRVYAVAFHPYGKMVASAGDDQQIRLWDITTQVCRKLIGHHSRIRALAFSPDGEWLVSGGEDAQLLLWHLDDQQQSFYALDGHTDRVCSVVFSPDGRTIASGGDDQVVYFWDVAKKTCRASGDGHRGRIYSLAFSPDGRMVVSGGDDQTVRFWDVSSGRCSNVLKEHRNRVRAVVVNGDGTIVASGGDDQAVRLWEMPGGQCLKTLQGYSNWIYAARFSPDGRLIASDGEGFSLHLWNAENGQMLQVLQGHTSWVYSLAFSPDGRLLASGSDDRSIRLWDVESGQCLKVFQEKNGRIRSIAFSPDGRLLASGSDDQYVRLWSVESGQVLHHMGEHTDRIRSVAIWDNTTILSAGEDQGVYIWHVANVVTGEDQTHILHGHVGRVWSLACNPRYNLIASGGDDQVLRFWNFESAECVGSLIGHTGRIYSIAFSPDGQFVASGSEDGTIRIWDVETQKSVALLEGHTERVRSVSYNVNGQWVVSGSHDNTVKIWDWQTGQCIRTLRADRPYERMNIRGLQGITSAQKDVLILLGAEAD